MSSSRTTTKRRLGEVLVELGAVTVQQVDEALASQARTGGRLGDTLLARGVVSQQQLLHALAVQYGHEFLDLGSVSIDADLLQRVPPQLARRHRAIPVGFEGERVLLAMANPADVLAIDDIRAALGRHVKPVMAEVAQIFAVLDRMGLTDIRVQEAIRAAVAESKVDEAVAEEVAPDQTESDRSPIVNFVNLLLSKAVQERASDIHIEPSASDLRIRFRIDGVLHEAMAPPKSLQAGIISRLKIMAEIDIAEKRIPQDGRMTIDVSGLSVDLRVVTMPTVDGEAVVLRILQNERKVEGLGSLGFLPSQLERFRQAIDRPCGAILVTGPTGSGKSTTLYATLEELRDPSINLMTIEDPVESRIEGVKQIQVNNKAGLTFANALRSFLRADPDVMLVGEIRDGETATIAIEASLTGHLVLSTLHTNSASATPARLIEMGVEPYLVTASITAVVAQRLARTLCGRCKASVVLDAAQADAAQIPRGLRSEDGSASVFDAVGCQACNDTGYRGRFAIHEVMMMTTEIGKLILENATSSEIEAVAIRQGMLTLREDGMRKVLMGLTTIEEIHRTIS